jgi:hypothetical protein
MTAPQWEVLVVDGNGKSVEGMTVRESWQNYSIETEGYEKDLVTDANGKVSFPAQSIRASILRRTLGTLRSAVTTGVHASFGPHAHVFAFGHGLEGGRCQGRLYC